AADRVGGGQLADHRDSAGAEGDVIAAIEIEPKSGDVGAGRSDAEDLSVALKDHLRHGAGRSGGDDSLTAGGEGGVIHAAGVESGIQRAGGGKPGDGKSVVGFSADHNGAI